MRTGIGHGRGTALSKYRERLAWLAGNVGRRNESLLGLCNCGVRAGLNDAQMEREIICASGTPPLTIAEVRRAIGMARRGQSVPTGRRMRPTPWRPAPKPPSPLGSGAASFVARMIERGTGATFETLTASSPAAIPPEPWKQTACFLSAMYDDTDYLFCGEDYHKGVLGKNVLMVKHWRQLVNITQQVLPYPLLIANPLTGNEGRTKDGKPSFRCSECVRRHRYALVEFDAMPLEEQCAFWAGVIETEMLPLRSLVYSGGKSLHGLVEIGAADRAAWDKTLDTLLCAVCNLNAPNKRHADRACRNPDRMTRLAGAWRQDKEKRQKLLWLAAPR